MNDSSLHESSALKGFPGGSVVKSMPADAGDTGLISGSERCPGEANGNPFQYSYLENPMVREDLLAIVHGVTQIWTVTEQISSSALQKGYIWWG